MKIVKTANYTQTNPYQEGSPCWHCWQELSRVNEKEVTASDLASLTSRLPGYYSMYMPALEEDGFIVIQPAA